MRRLLVGVLALATLAACTSRELQIIDYPRPPQPNPPGSWYLHYEKSLDSGHESCFVTSKGRHVIVQRFLGSDRGPIWSVRVGYDNYPGDPQFLKINDRRFSKSSEAFDLSTSEEIVAALLEGGMVAYEWSERRSRRKHEGEFPTLEFAAKKAECEKRIP